MKNKNYYSIHKNKKKRKSTLTEFQKTWKKLSPVLLKAVLFVQKAMEASQQRITPIPKYKMSGNAELAIVNDFLSPEVLEWKGKIHDFPYFDPNVNINLQDNIPMNIGYEKNSYQEFKNRTFEM